LLRAKQLRDQGTNVVKLPKMNDGLHRTLLELSSLNDRWNLAVLIRSKISAEA
jgi:hypothetical protein